MKKSRFLWGTFLLVALVSTTALAEDEPLPGLEISGFMDFLFSTEDNNPVEDDFGLNQAELDFDAATSQYSAISVAVAYDGEAFGLGAATLQFGLAGSEEGHLHNCSTFNSSGLIIGMFDVPFGIDWLFYPSIDRKLVSGPLAVAGTHDGWNDLGVSAYATTDWLNAVVYATNGFGQAYVDPDDVDELEVELASERAFGGRVGLTPTTDVEMGSSFAYFPGETDDSSMTMLGFDLQWTLDAFYLKGEYISHKHEYNTTTSLTDDGYYIQGMYELGSSFLVARYGQFEVDDPDAEAEERFSVGAGTVLTGASELRFEHQFGLSDNLEDTWVMQVVVGF